MTITLSLVNYNSNIQTLPPFNVEILPCIIESLAIATIPDKVYVIGSTLMSWSLVGDQILTQQPACGYVVDLVQSGEPSDIVNVTMGSTLTYSVYTRNLTYQNTSTIKVEATLKGY